MLGLYPKLGFDTLNKFSRADCYGFGPDLFTVCALPDIVLDPMLIAVRQLTTCNEY
jgi:hypothetical protein